MPVGTIWFTGLSGAGKSTVATTLKSLLDDMRVDSCMLDGDDLREGLNADLGYGEAERRENMRRVGEVALLFARTQHLVLVTLISPFTVDRDRIRARHGSVGVPFVEVHVATPLEVCEERDPKSLYARARRGEVPVFTGISSPYEAPVAPDIALHTVGESPEESAKQVLALLEARGLVAGKR